MSEIVEKVVVLDIFDSPENENDGIVQVLSQRGIFSLLAVGINKPESKNRANLQIGSFSEIEYFKSTNDSKLSKLKTATSLVCIDLNNNANIKYVSRVVQYLKHFKDPYPKIFNAYNLTLEFIGRGYNEHLLTYLLAMGLEYFGIGVNYMQCVECGTPSNFCDFRMYKGGFLCQKHVVQVRWNMELKAFYYMFTRIDTFLQVTDEELNEKIRQELLIHYKENGIKMEI